eukprot:GHVL01023642.1.p1 GENE.GHVL01023642.1~~GHVL01023642.1.p1  ORF type:complete len:1616 (+),score=219.26 GHVL01023642.1:253-4848(+)
MLDDEDVIFLAEWLSRFDCVVNLNISWNLIGFEGIKKITKHLKNTNTLKTLMLTGVNVDKNGLDLFTQALAVNASLEFLSFTIDYNCFYKDDENIETFARLLAFHPSLKEFGVLPIKLKYLSGMSYFLMDEFYHPTGHCPPTEVCLILRLLTIMRPQNLKKISISKTFGLDAEFARSCKIKHFLSSSIVPFIAANCDNLTTITLKILHGVSGIHSLMRKLEKSTCLQALTLIDYASCDEVIEETKKLHSRISSLSWTSKMKFNLDTLYNTLSKCKSLEEFNSLKIGNEIDESDILLMAGFHCIPGCEAQPFFCTAEQSFTIFEVKVGITESCDMDPLMHLLLMHPRSLLLEFQFCHNHRKVLKCLTQTDRLSSFIRKHLSGQPFDHRLVIKSLFDNLNICHIAGLPIIKEISINRIEDVVSVLVGSLTSKSGLNRLNIRRLDLLKSRAVPKRFTNRQLSQLTDLKTILQNRLVNFKEIVSYRNVIQSELARMTIEEFASIMSGVTLARIPSTPVSKPKVQVFVTDKKHILNPRLDRLLTLPCISSMLVNVNLAMCGIGALCQRLHKDEFAQTCKRSWKVSGLSRSRATTINITDEVDGIMSSSYRFHWRHSYRIGCFGTGSKGCYKAIETPVNFNDEFFLAPDNTPPSHDLLKEIIRSLLSSSVLESLDLRGNYLSKSDALLVIKMLENNKSLKFLNGLPVIVETAAKSIDLSLVSTGIDTNIGCNYSDIIEDESESISRSAIESPGVRIDEGDAFLFASFVTKNNFPKLNSLSIEKFIIPDISLTYIIDAILKIPTLIHLNAKNLQLSSRGRALLISAFSEMSPRVETINSLSLSALIFAPSHSLKLQSILGSHDPNRALSWDDVSLSLMSNLWRKLENMSLLEVLGSQFSEDISDTAIRSVSNLLTVVELPVKYINAHQLQDLRFTGNVLLTDHGVADICRAVGSSVWPIRCLDVRFCPRLRARSSFELIKLAQAPVKCLQSLNGVDVISLLSKDNDPPPMVIRTSPELCLSECDWLFFAQVLDLFPRIPSMMIILELSQRFAELAYLETLSDYASAACGLIPGVSLRTGESGPMTNVLRSVCNKGANWSGGYAELRTASKHNSFQPLKSAAEQERYSYHMGLDGQYVQYALDRISTGCSACPIQTNIQVSIIPRLSKNDEITSKGVICYIPDIDSSINIDESRKKIINNRRRRKIIDLLESEGKDQLNIESILKDPLHPSPDLLSGVKHKNKIYLIRLLRAFSDRRYFVNNINGQVDANSIRRLHCLTNDLIHEEVVCGTQTRIYLPSTISFEGLFQICTTLEIQEADLQPRHLSGIRSADITGLTHINFNHNKLGNVGCAILFRALAEYGSIVHVSLADNIITDEGIASITSVMPALNRLTSLDLDNNCITCVGATSISQALIGNIAYKTLETHKEEKIKQVKPFIFFSLDLSFNDIGDEGGSVLARLLQFHSSIEFLNLSCTNLTELSVKELTRSALKSTSLSILDLSFNGVDWSDDALEDLSEEFDIQDAKDGIFIRRNKENMSF